MTAKSAPNIDARQHFAWVLVSEIEMAPPKWGRPIRTGDVRGIAADFDPDALGTIALWYRSDLPVGRGRHVCLDGQHRIAAVRLMGYGDQKVPCLLYIGMTMETAAELSRRLQERRNLHPLDKYKINLAAHDRQAVEIDKTLQTLGLELCYSCKSTERGRLSAVGAVQHIWDVSGQAGLERILIICGQAWGHTADGYKSKIMRLVMTVVNAHNGNVDDVHLGQVLGSRSPAVWLADNNPTKRPMALLAQDVVMEYNKHVRGSSRLGELVPSDYEKAYKRKPVPSKRGTIVPGEAGTTSGPGRKSRRRTEPDNERPVR